MEEMSPERRAVLKKAALKYKKESQHPVSLSYKQSDFDNRIMPAIKKSGMPVATFIKKAVEEKIERDGLS